MSYRYALKDKERGVHHKELEVRQSEKKVLDDEVSRVKESLCGGGAQRTDLALCG